MYKLHHSLTISLFLSHLFAYSIGADFRAHFRSCCWLYCQPSEKLKHVIGDGIVN